MTIKEHLKHKRLEQHLTLDDVAVAVGVSRQTIQKYESGVIANIPFEKVERLALALHTTPAALMGWHDDVPSPTPVTPAPYMPGSIVPVLGHFASGRPIFAQEDRTLYHLPGDDFQCDFALRMQDDSMQPCLLEGDMVFVHSQSDVRDGQIAVLLLNDLPAVKHVYHLPDISGYQLISDNPAYPPLLLSGKAAQQAHIVGLVVAFQRTLA